MHKSYLVLSALLVFVLLAGCGERPGVKISHKEFLPGPGGYAVAEIWVEAPDPEGNYLEGDASQDVVFLAHAYGKTALPDRIMDTGVSPTLLTMDGYATVSVYHLVCAGREIGYYKRRFARN